MSRPRRLPAFSYTGCQRYFLTICTHERRRWFTDESHVTLVHDQILYTSKEQHVTVTAYCYMPDHLHALVTGETEDADLKRFVNLAKQRAGSRFAYQTGTRLWQEGYYERVLRDEETTPGIIEYIVANPVRAKLVERPQDYPPWGSGTHTREDLLRFIGHAPRWRP